MSHLWPPREATRERLIVQCNNHRLAKNIHDTFAAHGLDAVTHKVNALVDAISKNQWPISAEATPYITVITYMVPGNRSATRLKLVGMQNPQWN